MLKKLKMSENLIQFKINEIEERLALLQAILNYSRVFEAMFYRGEKICINQERGALFDLLNHYRDEAPDNVRSYRVPESIEEKINAVKFKVIQIYNL